MDNEEKPQTKFAQLLTSVSLFSICRQTFAYLLIIFFQTF